MISQYPENNYSVRIGYRAMDLYEDELYEWMDTNTTWGSADGISNYILRFKKPAEFTLFLLKWGSVCEHELNPNW